jgi:hypothetical protein
VERFDHRVVAATLDARLEALVAAPAR